MSHEDSSPPTLGRHNPRVARLRRIVRRQEPQLTVVDGLRLVQDLARRHAPPILEVYTDAERLPVVASTPELRPLFPSGGVFLLDSQLLSRLAPTTHSQGVLAVVPVHPRSVVPEGVVLFLDRVQDPGNVGSVIRSAAGLGGAGVACSPGCADPFSPRAVRASAGQSLLFPIAVDASFVDLAAAFRSAGGNVAGTVGAGGLPLREWHPRKPLLVAFGNEGQGLASEIESECHSRITIPLQTAVESLNVAVTAGIILAYASALVTSPILEG